MKMQQPATEAPQVRRDAARECRRRRRVTTQQEEQHQMADRVILALTLVLAGVYFWATSQIPTLEIGDPLGPKAFPRLLGIGLLITAAMLFFEVLRARKSPAVVDAAAQAEDNRHYLIIAGVVGWTFLFFLVFETLGYMISAVIYLLGMFAYFHKNKWTSNILTAVLFAAISYFLFTKALGVNLARGFLPF
jgi:putative tricarboxylic transport membrane protein